ncbi:MAG: hypothetical protein IKN38_07835, partial [Clostridia bacterium]|nr:hypothetical protein [Clostridia bacterium]
MKKYIALILALVCILLPACADDSAMSGSADTKQAEQPDTGTPAEYVDDGGNVRLTFAESIDMGRITKLSGRTVEIIGYMATVSPVSGKYLYLMNLPY